MSVALIAPPDSGQGLGYETYQRNAAVSFYESQAAARQALRGIDWEAVQRRFLADMLAQAMPAQWEQRAAQLEACKPMPGEFSGRATAEELDARRARLAGQAAACRLQAALLRCINDPGLDLVTEVNRLEATK